MRGQFSTVLCIDPYFLNFKKDLCYNLASIVMVGWYIRWCHHVRFLH
jgi:hypothetical protein